jgi:hypothetical protein
MELPGGLMKVMAGYPWPAEDICQRCGLMDMNLGYLGLDRSHRRSKMEKNHQHYIFIFMLGSQPANEPFQFIPSNSILWGRVFPIFPCDLRSYCMNSYMFAKERSWASATWRAQGANAMGALVSWHPKRWRDVKILGSQHTAEWKLWLTLDAKKEIWLWSCIQLKNEVLLRQKGANKNWQTFGGLSSKMSDFPSKNCHILAGYLRIGMNYIRLRG